MDPKLISVADFCTMCGIRKTTAYKFLGQVQSMKIGRRRLILMDSVNAFIAAGAAARRADTEPPTQPDRASPECAR